MEKNGRFGFDRDKRQRNGSETGKTRSDPAGTAAAGLIGLVKAGARGGAEKAKSGFREAVQAGKSEFANLLGSAGGGAREANAPGARGRPAGPCDAAAKRPEPLAPAEEARRGAKYYEFLLEQTAQALEKDEDEGIAGEMIDEWDQALDSEYLPGLRARFHAIRANGGGSREFLQAWISELNGLGIRRYPSDTAVVKSPEELVWYFSGQTHSVGETLLLERRPWLLEDPATGKTTLISRGLIRKAGKQPENAQEAQPGGGGEAQTAAASSAGSAPQENSAREEREKR